MGVRSCAAVIYLVYVWFGATGLEGCAGGNGGMELPTEDPWLVPLVDRRFPTVTTGHETWAAELNQDSLIIVYRC
jgi:hypothetical protein